MSKGAEYIKYASEFLEKFKECEEIYDKMMALEIGEDDFTIKEEAELAKLDIELCRIESKLF